MADFSSLGDAFWNRVLARAEARERTKKQVEAGNYAPVAKAKPGVSATAQWNAAIQKHIDAGMDRMKAAKAVNRQHPGLRQRFIAEANAKRGQSVTSQSTTPVSRPATTKQTTRPVAGHSFGAAVRALEDSGMDRVSAVRKVKEEQPHLLERARQQAGL